MIKRTPLNRFLSMVLCLCMVLSLLPGIPLVANAAETEIETYAAERYMTIYFRNDWNWTQIKLYFWGSKTDTNPDWPGKSMTYYGASGGKNYYSLQVPTDVTGFIISGIKDDGSGTRDQSPDIKSGWYNGITYYMFWNNGNQVKSFNIRDVFACKHPNQQTVAGYAATCTKDGLSDGKKCTDCGQMVTAQKVIPATGHKFVDEVCSVCGAEQYVEVYFRNDWNWSEVSLYYWNSESVDNGWPGEAMTFYDNDGEFDYYVMKVPTDVAGIIIDGLKDDGSGELDQSPDIKSGWYDGIVYYMRWDNGNKVSSLNIADVKFPCKHLNQETVSGHDATCTGDGLTDGIKCSDCGETIKKQEVIPALGHDWNAATCTCPKTCSVCGVTEGENLGHSYDNDCDADCNTCGEPREPGEHQYYYDCDTNCVVCGELTRPEATHVSNMYPCCDGVCMYGCGLEMPATAEHTYDNDCDADCNICFMPREVSGHTYDNDCDADCNICGDVREPGEHQYYYDCDTNCVVCGELTRPEATHVSNMYPCCDGVCMYGCGTFMPATAEHTYDNDCDADCNICFMPREVSGHSYDNDCDADCNICGDVRWVPGHSYDNDCDADCNICGDVREPGEHRYYYACDTNCLACGELTRPDAIHLSNSASCADGVCLYGCGTFMPATDGHKYECYYEIAPTCSQSGAYYYQCVQCGDSYEEYPSATGNHTYDNACDANCNTCGDVRDVPGHTDADNSGRCDSCRILMQPAKICFATASLEGNIAINFYTLLSDEVIADPDNAYMQFTMANGPVIKVLVSEAVYGELNGETYYMFTCSVNAKEMADDVICQFFYEGGSTAEITYNVKEYGNYIINNNDDASAKAMAQAMLNYGAASQLHFGHNTDNLANAELGTPDYSNVTIEGFDAEAGQGTELAKLYSASLILKSETTLRFFFKVDSSVENFTVMLNGEALEVNVRSGLHYVDVVGIAAKDLDKAVTLTINDGTTTADVSFNPMSYCQGVLNDTTGAFDAEMKDLVAALYLYNQAAKEYFKEG